MLSSLQPGLPAVVEGDHTCEEPKHASEFVRDCLRKTSRRSSNGSPGGLFENRGNGTAVSSPKQRWTLTLKPGRARGLKGRPLCRTDLPFEAGSKEGVQGKASMGIAASHWAPG